MICLASETPNFWLGSAYRFGEFLVGAVGCAMKVFFLSLKRWFRKGLTNDDMPRSSQTKWLVFRMIHGI